jgi:hypothetical protein
MARLTATHVGYLLADPPRLERVGEELMAFVSAHGMRPWGRSWCCHEQSPAHLRAA